MAYFIKEIKIAINTLDFLSKDPKERERHNSIVMAEYNRLVSEHNFFEDGKKENSIEIAKAYYDLDAEVMVRIPSSEKGKT